MSERMTLRVVSVAAEALMVKPLAEAAGGLRSGGAEASKPEGTAATEIPGASDDRGGPEPVADEIDLDVRLEHFLLPELKDPTGLERLRVALRDADILIGSMLNSQPEAERLERLLREVRPPVVAIFHSAPELVLKSRLGDFDAGDPIESGGGSWGDLLEGLSRREVQFPPDPMAILSSLARFLPELEEEGLDEHQAYAAASLAWLHGSPANLRSMLLHLARFAPALPQTVRDRLRPNPLELFPDVALWHPEAPSLFDDWAAYRRWRAVRSAAQSTNWSDRPRVGLLLFRQYVAAQNTAHYAAVVKALEREGLAVVPGYAHMDATPLCEGPFAEAGVEAVLNLSGFNLVGSMGHPRPEKAVELLGKLDVPYLVGLPLLFQQVDAWRGDPIGLAPTQTALQVVLTELEGGVEPRVYAGSPVGIRDAAGDPSAGRAEVTRGRTSHGSAVGAASRTAVERPAAAGSRMAFAGAADPEMGAPPPHAQMGPQTELEPYAPQVKRLARRVRRWVDLRRKPRSERRIAVTLFSFPPDKGSVGTAAYLDVFHSLYRLMARLRDEGYAVELPDCPDVLQREVAGAVEGGGIVAAGAPRHAGAGEGTPVKGTPVGTDSAESGGPQVAARWPVGEYRRHVPQWERVARAWGEPPGKLEARWDAFEIRGRGYGNLFVGVQPSFGYEGDPMRLLLAPDASPSHSFAAYYGWLENVWGADAVLHLGTHGALEFMPGKQVGLSEACSPDWLIGELPHLYFYSINNPSEASIAKRRGYAAIVSYLSPPMAQAGLYRTLAELKDAVVTFLEGSQSDPAGCPAHAEGAPSDRGRAAWESICTLAGEAHLTEEVEGLSPDVPPAERERVVRRFRSYLVELESRLIPVGLHVAGSVPQAEALEEYAWAEVQYERPEAGTGSLPGLVAGMRGWRWDELSRMKEDERRAGVLHAAREALHALIQGGEMAGRERLVRWVKEPGADRGGAGDDWSREWSREWSRIAERVRAFLGRLGQNEELSAMVGALDGGYIPPSPGGDPVREPAVLPTGRNMHALDPQRIPGAVARRRAKEVVDRLLERLRPEQGRYPESVGMVLWGTDNIKTGGEGVAQALQLMGVEALPDSLGQMTRLRLIPLHELGRPRIDVVMNLSGIFRDIFPTTMAILDRAVRLAAGAEEPAERNFVRKHARELAQELACSPDEASTRIFSNAPGMYGTGVNHVVESSDWEEREELAALFVGRKGFGYSEEVNRTGAGEEKLFAAALSRVEATFQNLDSTEISLSDVDHYYEYLGGMTAAVGALKGERPPALLVDAISPDAEVRTLEETLRIECRTRILNPKWYEGMLNHGYQGVNEIATRMENTFGWSATADAVDGWVYGEVAQTFFFDDAMRRRLKELNPKAAQRMAERLMEATDRGYWDAEPGERERLYGVVREMDDRIEGVA